MTQLSRSSSDPIVIIGGGLMGVTTLYELVSRGQPAILLERGEDVAGYTSYANGGMLHASACAPWNGPGVAGHLVRSLFSRTAPTRLRWSAIPGLTRWGLEFLTNASKTRHETSTWANHELAVYSMERTRQWLNTLDLDCDRGSEGLLFVYSDEASFQRALDFASHLDSRGTRSEVLSPAEVLKAEPQLSETSARLVGGIFYPDDFACNARQFTQSLADKARDLGGEIQTGTDVTRLMTKAGAIKGVQTSKGDISAQSVVLAAGVGAPGLLRASGLRLPVQPAKGYSLTIQMDQLGHQAPRIAVLDDHMHAGIVPIGSVLRLVGTAEFAGHDDSLELARIENLKSLFLRLYPHLADRVDWSAAEAWAGLRPMSSDGRPFIGPTPVNGLWLNTGHGHLGWTQAAGSAALLVDLMDGQDPALDPDPFRFGR